ncbi:hypothetical protein K402DRAFT_42862 [Aulographum hederae CBS 113979]|uniref:RING zinc finger-like domain-containing protein n=1 Tax=Aulographum hederae CBS 113979 TaxID=1176131 RepID=A0A6G1H3P6_9PEZI|nr:hypothetical protein K402DRAFT_42862 [Aulographum hederae CBS 113979]
MPPRSALTTSFPVSDANNEVVCPLKHHDGSSCRKRCLGEKRYRSMQEHIRRAHPEHYISKLPATEESFLLMVNTPPSERPQLPPSTSAGPSAYDNENKPYYNEEFTYGDAPRSSDEYRRGSLLPAESAAAALAQLHTQTGWDSEQDTYSEAEAFNRKHRAHFAPTHEQHFYLDESYPEANTSRPRELLPSMMSRSPPGRSSTLPPGLTPYRPNRPRKSSVGQNARKPKHERQKSKDQLKRLSHDRKAYSAEPSSAAAMFGKRWEDLISAASSAKEEDSRDITPVPDQSPNMSPHMPHRSSLPPYLANQIQSYNASPLQNEMTPPPPDANDIPLFPSVESSIESTQSGHNFHMTSQGLSDSSPSFPQSVQIYCAGCNRLSMLMRSYACTECICGLCQDCVDVLVGEQTRGKGVRCPKCGAVGGKFKPFQLDIR